MISITCDRCEREIQAGDDQAGQKIACPHCGDINRVPGGAGTGAAVAGSPAGGSDRASRAGLPPDSGPERQVLRVRRCWFRSRPLAFTGVVLAAGGTVAGLASSYRAGHAPWALWAWALAGVVFLGVLAYWWVDRLTASLVITNKRTVEHRGLLSRSTSEVVHDNIRNVQVDQTFWQRVWGVGRLGISSSGQDGIEIQMDHLPGPERLRETIDLYRPL